MHYANLTKKNEKLTIKETLHIIATITYMNIEYFIQRTEYNKMILSKQEIQKQGQYAQRSKVIRQINIYNKTNR